MSEAKMFKKKSLQLLFDSPVSDEMIKFLTDNALRVLPTASHNHGKHAIPTPPGTPSESGKNHGVPS